jgi:DNA-binding CsgD family transcriptional regulator
MTPKITDQEFLRLWDEHKSPLKVAKATGLSERRVHTRRRAIENKLNINLKSGKAVHIQKARHEAGLTDGIAIIFSDAHFWPGIRTTAFKGLLWAINELKPHVVVANGDIFDGSSISRHARINWSSVPNVKQELQACQEALKEIEDACEKARHHTQLIWPLGNHDSRFETRLSEAAPQFEGVGGTALKDHFPKWHHCWSCWLSDNVVIKHRYKNGTHATHTNTLNSGVTTITGHLHSLKVTPFGDYNGTRWGVDTGTLAEIDGPQFIDYLEDGPVNWRSGFAVVTMKNSKPLWPELVSKHAEGIIDFRGQLIDVSGY